MDDMPGLVIADMSASTPSIMSPSESVECGIDEEDSWVVVKKQKIIILIPPPSPSNQPQSTLSEKYETETKAVKRNKGRLPLTNKDKNEEPSCKINALAGDTEIISSTSAPQEQPIHNLVALPTELKPPKPSLANNANYHRSDRYDTAAACKQIMPIGALNVVNKRVRAINLERKLNRHGGLRSWLMSHEDLHRFVKVFDTEKVGTYQLANVINMSMLKDMGIAPVGPRRKLIHAIDGLCQPYFVKTSQ